MKRLTRNTLKWSASMLLAGLVLLVSGIFAETNAVSQWSRKYKTPCSTCHIAFPRLNYYGERFMRNGYQDPDDEEADGDKLGKRVLSEELSIDRLENHVGVRLNFTPLRVETDALIVDGEKKARITIGNPNWYQVFIAGTIAKNISIFIEAENDGSEMHFTWNHLGFHNLGGTSLVNFFVGNLSPLDFASYANRLRQLGAIKATAFGIKSSGGAPDSLKAEDPLNVSGSRPGIMWFGYQGPAVVWAGISPGNQAKDANDKRHYWGGVKLEIPEAMESVLEGSSVTGWVYYGEDASNTAGALPVGKQVTNPFLRWSLQGNLRWRNLDVQVAYLGVDEDNYHMAVPADSSEQYSGFVAIGGYRHEEWYPALMFDLVSYDSNELADRLDRMFIIPSLSYFLRQNVRAGVHAKIDVTDETMFYERSHDIQLNFRIMF